MKEGLADELATLRGMLAGVAKFEDLYCAALRQLRPELAPDFAEFTRLETYDAGMRVFR